MAKANIDHVVQNVSKDLADGMLAAQKKAAKTTPYGMEQIGPKELAKRWAHLGDEQRQRLRQSMATPEDPSGNNAILSILERRGGPPKK